MIDRGELNCFCIRMNYKIKDLLSYFVEYRLEHLLPLCRSAGGQICKGPVFGLRRLGATEF